MKYDEALCSAEH